MGGEDIHICQICQSEFETEEDLSLHACVEIKEELQDPKILVGYDICHDYGLDLSEEFLSGILKLVNELCDVVRNGDPDLKRTSEVNKNLNTAVSCYRSRLLLIDSKHIEMQDNWDNYDNLPQESKMESDKSDSDTDYKPKIENKAKKNHVRKVTKPKFSRPEKPKIDSKDIDETIKAETKSDIEINPKFKNAKNLRNPDDIFLYPYVKYISETELQCLCCDAYTHRMKSRVFRHLRTVHKTEINWNKEPEKLNDCETGVCKKLYGFRNKEMWCIQCSAEAKIKRKLSESKQNEPKKIYENILKVRICPECGKSVPNLSSHMTAVHSNENVPCPHCDRVCKSKMYLNQHIKKVHEKAPCVHCGQLVSLSYMKRHIQAQHTADNEKDHRCDVCNKGFSSKIVLKDHMNIHTGEKPYKCKFCSSCFASRGNHAMHERGHLGNGRKSK